MTLGNIAYICSEQLKISFMSRKVKIYAILCPITKEVKYVGKTFGTLKDRLSRHISNSKDKSKKKIWIIENVKNNMFPEIMLIDEVDSVLSNVTEKKWILYYGIDNLLNENKGGGGCSIKGFDDVLNKYKIFLIDNYSKNTVSNYMSCVKLFLSYYNNIPRAKNINKIQVQDYLNTINDVNSKKIALSSIKLFYSEIIKQPNKLKTIKYQYK